MRQPIQHCAFIAFTRILEQMSLLLHTKAAVPQRGINPLHLPVGNVRAGLRRLLRLRHRGCSGCSFWCVLLAVGFARVVLAQPDTFEGNPDSSAFIWIPKDTDDWTRHFRIGAVVGMNISANFSRSGTFGISGNNPAQGIYDNGYVRPDQDGDTGFTTYWGYNNRSQQYNAAAQTLTMTAATSFTANSSAKETGVFPGFDMAYGGNLWYWKHARVGWELGFDLLPINISESSTTIANVNQNTYTFSATEPGFPSTTSYQGPFSGSGYFLSTAFTEGSTNITGTVSGKQTLDVMLYAFRLGPTAYWDLTDHLGMSLGAGPAVGLVSGDYKYDETVTAGNVSAHNTGKIDGTDLIYGGYVNATLLWHVTDNGDIYAGAQYMPMSNATISGGGRSGRLNLGGQVYFTIGINWPF